LQPAGFSARDKRESLKQIEEFPAITLSGQFVEIFE